jgi:hypothetical protein
VVKPVATLAPLDLTLERRTAEVSDFCLSDKAIDDAVKVAGAYDVAPKPENCRRSRKTLDAADEFLLSRAKTFAVFADSHVQCPMLARS